jgi:UDP-N-acetylglucosamine--N-acetylmuramyl-(pentapeptide) pyrophosphoryl-undecaprenol N-acetylglucosamine transferase
MGKTIVLTGGGTAGHVTPNLAISDDLIHNGYRLHYIGTQNGIEHELVTNMPYHVIEAGKLRRYLSKENIRDFFRVFKGYRQAKKILRELDPALVFAKGGYVSVPVVYAAAKLRIPVVLHESDYSPGLANRLCVKKARIICLSFDTPAAHAPKGVFTGSPVRAGLLSGNRENGLDMLGFNGAKPVLLVMGGSLGAKAINDIIDSGIQAFAQDFQIVHLRGRGNLNPSLEHMNGYRQFEYVNERLADIFAATDIVLSRAGANAIFEFVALGIPSMLVPLPLSASRGDQLENAEYFKEHGYSLTLRQEELTVARLRDALQELVSQKDAMRGNIRRGKETNGTQNVLDVIYGYICQ